MVSLSESQLRTFTSIIIEVADLDAEELMEKREKMCRHL